MDVTSSSDYYMIFQEHDSKNTSQKTLKGNQHLHKNHIQSVLTTWHTFLLQNQLVFSVSLAPFLRGKTLIQTFTDDLASSFWTVSDTKVIHWIRSIQSSIA